MPIVETKPRSRFGWPGARLTYELHSVGASDVALGDVPEKLGAHLTPVESSAESYRALLTLTPTKDAGFD